MVLTQLWKQYETRLWLPGLPVLEMMMKDAENGPFGSMEIRGQYEDLEALGMDFIGRYISSTYIP